MRRVEFVDTSILVEFLNVPGRSQHRKQVLAEFKRKRASGTHFVLPTAAGSPGVFQPRAPTERNVTVSRHSALLTHPSEIGHPRPVNEELWLSSLELTPPPP